MLKSIAVVYSCCNIALREYRSLVVKYNKQRYYEPTNMMIIIMFAVGCTSTSLFDVTDASIDGARSMPPPDSLTVPASCFAIHKENPALPSGVYMIDPDGANGDAAISVTCDMMTDGGGWTVVYFAPSEAIKGLPIMYTGGDMRLMADAQHVLIAYRSATGVAYTNYARFDLPSAWRTQTPFGFLGNDLTTGVSINGSALTTATVRYGSSNFVSACNDPWFGLPGNWGRLCIVGTQAPFFNAFMLGGTDYCSDSSQPYFMIPCTHDKRFSIAVR